MNKARYVAEDSRARSIMQDVHRQVSETRQTLYDAGKHLAEDLGRDFHPDNPETQYAVASLVRILAAHRAISRM